MHLILTGATGLVGSGVLQYVLSVPDKVTKLSVLSRKPVPLAEGHAQVTVIQHDDFSSYPADLLEKLKGAEGCIWALGVSQNAVNKEEYAKITKDYTLDAAEAFKGLSDPFKFVYVSGEGATLTPGMFTPIFGRVKGETEAALLALSKTSPPLRVYSVRPAAVDPTKHPEIHHQISLRKTPLYKRALSPILLPAFRIGYPNMISPTRDLGRFMTDLATGDGEQLEGNGISGEGRTINNKAIRALAGM